MTPVAMVTPRSRVVVMLISEDYQGDWLFNVEGCPSEFTESQSGLKGGQQAAGAHLMMMKPTNRCGTQKCPAHRDPFQNILCHRVPFQRTPI